MLVVFVRVSGLFLFKIPDNLEMPFYFYYTNAYRFLSRALPVNCIKNNITGEKEMKTNHTK